MDRNKDRYAGLPKAELKLLQILFHEHGAHICETFRDDEEGQPVLKVVVSEGYARVTEWLDRGESEVPLAKACPSFTNGIIEVMPRRPGKDYEEGESRFWVLDK